MTATIEPTRARIERSRTTPALKHLRKLNPVAVAEQLAEVSIDGGRITREEQLDERGSRGIPYRSLSLLLTMERAGTITAAMRAAGETFNEKFYLAHLDPLRAADIERVPCIGALPPLMRNTKAGEMIWRALIALGGSTIEPLRAPAANCAWHVLGEGKSLRQWCELGGWSGRALNVNLASGILVGTLGVLQRVW